MQHQRLENLQLAFNAAERLFQVPKLLTPQDFIDTTPDERSVMLYLALLMRRLVPSKGTMCTYRRCCWDLAVLLAGVACGETQRRCKCDVPALHH